ncbi:unnamed protein product [Polarella glacialis]|uniref:RRM domain-containing protein n=1 Tax=Polarella glacialis TaxID=89957 RepID=A0A813DB44_POLGL|nr:unnamed protein product [Polarella glacialis]
MSSEARACIAKDMTMPNECIMSGVAGQLRARWLSLPLEAQRGAVVILIQVPPPRIPRKSSSQGEVSLGAPSHSGELLRIVQLLLKAGVPAQKAALLAAQLAGEPVARAQEAVRNASLGSGAGASNAADAVPVGQVGGSMAQQTLHLVNIGIHTSKEELAMVLAEVGAAIVDLSLAETHLGGKIAFVRFASPEAAARARASINLASLKLGGNKPVLAGWARRDRWLG